MIEVRGLSKKYDRKTALDIPSLTISPGECFGLVGNNGAGKTTFLRLILDLVLPSQGSVASKGLDVTVSESWKRYTGSYLDESFLIEFLTPMEYFRFIANLQKVTSSQLRQQLQLLNGFFNEQIIEETKYIRQLSKGNQKKVGIAAALIGEPEIIILDEPFANLDPRSVIQLLRILQHIRQERTVTLIISSHNLNHITEICERIALLDNGRIIQDIQTDEHTLKTLERYFSGEEEV